MEGKKKKKPKEVPFGLQSYAYSVFEKIKLLSLKSEQILLLDTWLLVINWLYDS